MDARTHLHVARLARRMDLQALSRRTALSQAVLRHIDEGRFQELPAGVYARSYVRTFAAEVGLDPRKALTEIEHLLPQAEDPIPALREARCRQPSWSAARWAAVGVDAGILLAVEMVLITAVSVLGGLPIVPLLNDAAPAVSALLCVPVVAYFVVFAGIGGRTPGAALCRVPPPPKTPLTLSVIFQRAMAPIANTSPAQLAQSAETR